jgi:predicted transcriptional regulator
MATKRDYQGQNTESSFAKVLLALNQPLITRQISKKTGIPTYTCSYIIATFVDSGVLVCLNPHARNNRLYWFTKAGLQYLQQLYSTQNLTYSNPLLPDIDWNLYGWACFSHRSAIIKALTHPMQPSEIKRLFRFQKTQIRISANNIRDIIHLFLTKGIVRPVNNRGKSRPRYELTETGIKLRHLLIQAGVAP